jgi:hypothetical protein
LGSSPNDSSQPQNIFVTVEQALLGESRACELESDREIVAQPRRDRDRRDPRERHRDCAEVVEVHGQGVVGLGAELEGRPRAGRRDDEVKALERGAEVL